MGGAAEPRAVERRATECVLRAVAQMSVAFANRAGLAGAAQRPCDPITKIGRAPCQSGRNECPVGSPRRTCALLSERQYRDRRRLRRLVSLKREKA